MKKPKQEETLEEAAERWVFDTNGHKWSNNDDTAGDNYNSFIKGTKWQQERMYSEEEVLHILDTLWDRLDIWYNRGMECDETEFNLKKWFNECELKKK